MGELSVSGRGADGRTCRQVSRSSCKCDMWKAYVWFLPGGGLHLQQRLPAVKMIAKEEMDFGLVGRLPLRRKPLLVPLMEILILFLREEESSSRGPLKLHR